ncbi:MAG: hypothetical protein ABI207_03870 [Crocinitomicaceae bacterium]
MKLKSLLFVAGVAIMLTSCFKSRNCQCTTTSSTGATSVSNETMTGIAGVNSSKKSQESACKSNESSNSYGSTKCELTK